MCLTGDVLVAISFRQGKDIAEGNYYGKRGCTNYIEIYVQVSDPYHQEGKNIGGRDCHGRGFAIFASREKILLSRGLSPHLAGKVIVGTENLL